MRIQIIPSEKQKFLKDYYGCNLWKIYDVIKVYELKSHWKCKEQKEWKEYVIEAIDKCPCNFQGQKTLIRIKDDECIVL